MSADVIILPVVFGHEPVRVPADHQPADVIILPVVRIPRTITPIGSRRARRRSQTPPVDLPWWEEQT